MTTKNLSKVRQVGVKPKKRRKRVNVFQIKIVLGGVDYEWICLHGLLILIQKIFLFGVTSKHLFDDMPDGLSEISHSKNRCCC